MLERWLIAKVADKEIGESLTTSAKYFCDSCKSTNLSLHTSKPMGVTDIPEVNFSQFEILSAERKDELLRNFVSEYHRINNEK